MSNNDIIDFPTSANQGVPMPDETVPQPKPAPSPEELAEMQQQGGEQMLQLIQKNRKMSHENLQRAYESLESIIESIKDNRSDGALFVKKDERGKIYFSLEDALRTVMKGLGACLTSMEANNSLMDMLIHDFGGLVHNMNQSQRAMLMANSHTQILTELLREKGIVSEPELKATWDRLVQEKQEQMRKVTSEQ